MECKINFFGNLLQPVLPNDDTGLHCAGQVLNSSPIRSPRQAVDVSPVLEWLRSLGLAKYEENFVREEIDWDSLQWLSDEVCFMFFHKIDICLFKLERTPRDDVI